jgi:antirestriction protein ArdC
MQSQAYINGWIKHLKNNPKEIVFASGQSQKAVEYILNK